MLTYKECKEICDTTDNDSIFHEYKYEIDNYKISVFCYRKEVTKQDFTKSDYKDIREFRGITFVHNLDNTYKRYIMLPKIFNYSEIEDNLYDNLKDKCLNKVYKKEDGSFINFIRLPNRKLVAKTKASFDDPVCDIVQTFINNNPIYKDIINESIDNDIQLFFEYVSYKRRIVVDYKSEDLILINIRDNNTGEFLNIDKYRDKISVTNEYTYNNILEIIDDCQILEDTEGFISIFEDGHIVKFKTKWYYNNHKMLMDENLLEHMIVKLYLTGYIDDILAKLNSDYKEEKVKIEYIENIINIVNDKRKYLKKELLDIFDNYTDSKELALSSIDNEIKQLALNTIRYKENIDDNITEHILRMTKRKEMAIKYLKL